jgi:hypothetical protein
MTTPENQRQSDNPHSDYIHPHLWVDDFDRVRVTPSMHGQLLLENVTRAPFSQNTRGHGDNPGLHALPRPLLWLVTSNLIVRDRVDG